MRKESGSSLVPVLRGILISCPANCHPSLLDPHARTQFSPLDSCQGWRVNDKGVRVSQGKRGRQREGRRRDGDGAGSE